MNADERMHYSVLFLGERPNLPCEEATAFFRRDVDCDFIWDESEVCLGLLLRYRLAMFSHVIIDNGCSDALCELIFTGFSITTGTTFKFLSDGIAFGKWDKQAGTAFFHKGSFGSLKKLGDDWYHVLNDAMKRARVSTCGGDNDCLFPQWLDAWADSYVDFLQANGNVPAASMSSLARAIIQRNEAQWSEREDLIWLLTIFISRLKRFAVANRYNLDCDEDNIVAHVFAQKITAPQQQLCYFRGHVICVIRFMQWLIQELVEGHNVYGLIENLVVDLYALNKVVLNNAISDLYSGHYYGQRCGCPLTRWDHYKDAYRVAIYQHSPIWRTVAEITGIAGLRQALESGFSRIIGLKWTDAHMHHDLIPDALQHCHEIIYPNSDNNTPLDKVMLIYAWTNTAVHKALSDAVWLIWEAFNYCSILFRPNSNSGVYNIDSAVQMPLKSLYEVRRRVVEGFCEWARVAHVNSVRIQWDKPEAVILDQDVHQRNWNVYEHCGMAICKSDCQLKSMGDDSKCKGHNILIIQGSPRANGNTAWMAAEYRKAAEAAGHKVTLVDVAHKKIAGCMACEYCRGKGNGACVQKDDMQELYPLIAEADVLVLAAPIYYFTLSAQIQAPIQRIHCMNKPGKLKKMALLVSSYSPDVYDCAIGEYRGILNYWGVEDAGVVTAKIDEQKTEATRNHILELVAKLSA